MRHDKLICDTLFCTDLHCASCFSIGGFFSERKWKGGGNGSELTAKLNHASHANEVMKTHTVPSVAIMNINHINRQRTSNGYEEEDIHFKKEPFSAITDSFVDRLAEEAM